MKKKVMLGMSGGVDSSVAALLLKNAGYDVTGVTLRLRPDRYMEQCVPGGCCSIDDIDDARRVAYKLGIEHLVFNFTDIFEETVIDYFVKEYEQGRTPNPCIACNRHVKFNAMMKRAIELGFDYVATGHYACIEQNKQGRCGKRSKLCIIFPNPISIGAYFAAPCLLHKTSNSCYCTGSRIDCCKQTGQSRNLLCSG